MTKPDETNTSTGGSEAFSVRSSMASSDGILRGSQLTGSRRDRSDRSEAFSIRSSTTNADGILRDSQLNRRNSDGVGVLQSRALRRDSSLAFSQRLQSEFTVNKLQISSLGLYGRDDEKYKLKSVLERVISNNKTYRNNSNETETGESDQQLLQRELIWVKGFSGCGKSCFVDEVLRNFSKRPGVLHIRGEFDAKNKEEGFSEPYSAISSACDMLCEKLLKESTTTSNQPAPSPVDTIRAKVPADQLKVLRKAFPSLARIAGASDSEEGSVETDQGALQEASNPGHVEAKNRFHFAFRMFLRIAGSLFSCLVLVLDDLQWADEASIELFRLLVNDRDNPSLVLIGCYRSDELSLNPLMQAVVDEQKSVSSVNVTEINIGKLQLNHVNSMLMDLLRATDESETLELAKICHKKTMGNPFFIKMFLLSLEQQQLLQFNLGLLKWIWEEELIEEKTQFSDNVVEFMTQRMEGLPSHVQKLLEIAACLGKSFSTTLLNRIWEKMQPSDDIIAVQHSLEDGILAALKEGLIEQTGEDDYRFSHDKVQEAASSIKHEEMNLLRRQIGELLVATLDQQDLDTNIFTAVNLLNQSTDQKSITQAQHNLSAATKAATLSAIESAAKYAMKGIQCLPDNCWTDQRELSLQLYSIAAETEGYLGQIGPMEEHCEVVLSQTSDVMDKVRVYNALLDSYANRGQFQDAHRLCQNVLAELGCKFPTNKIVRALRTRDGLRRLRRAAKHRTAANLSNMTVMEDPVRIEMMKLLEKLATYSYLMADWALYFLVVLREVDWTDRYGLSETASHAFGCAGLVFSALLGKYQTGSIYGEQALRVVDKVKFGRLEAQSKFVVYSFVLHWTKSSHLMDRALFDAYEAGMRAGDIEYAMYSLQTFLMSALQSGRLLELLEADCRNYTRQMVEHKRIHTLIICSQIWQLILNLMGRCKNPLVLSGEALHGDELRSDANIHQCFLRANYQMLYAIYDNHELGAKLALKEGQSLPVTKVIPGMSMVITTHFYEGISCLAVAQTSRKGIYLRHGKKILASMREWARKGNPNVIHCKTLLEAELAAYKRKTERAKTLFETTISLARGRIHDAALAHERYAVFLLRCGDETEAKFQLVQASSLYRDWGAKGKLASLREKYADMLEPSEEAIVPPLI